MQQLEIDTIIALRIVLGVNEFFHVHVSDSIITAKLQRPW